MYIYSYERRTGRGAYHATEVLESGVYAPVSELWGSEKVGRANGFDIWRVERMPGDRFRAVHRSNSGATTIDHGRQCRGYPS